MEKLKQTQKRPDTSRASHLLARKVVPRAYEQISDRAMVNQISAVCFVCVVVLFVLIACVAHQPAMIRML